MVIASVEVLKDGKVPQEVLPSELPKKLKAVKKVR